MLRRTFVGGVVPLTLLGSSFRLHAFAGALLPASLTLGAGRVRALSILPGDPRIFELRTYEGLVSFEGSLERAGIDGVEISRGTWLLAFASLEARAEAWNRLNSMWRGQFQRYQFSLYRA